MFTGIIEAMGVIESVEKKGSNVTFWVKSPISQELKIDQSISHDGVCLTVEEVTQASHRVTAIAETIDVTNLSTWQKDAAVNLERCMIMNGRIDGHIVQGHVDTTGFCKEITEKDGSTEYRFAFPDQYAALVIEKGSICLNGISLTVFNVTKNEFTVAIIPYTIEHTNMKQLQKDSKVNLEFDVIGKYILRSRELEKATNG